MYYFTSDYTEGCHPQLLNALAETNWEQTPGYGEDAYCEAARQLIRKACQNDQADVHFLVGGTQANLTAICAALRPHQGVLAAVTSHINTHEAGAIERTGHKVIEIAGRDGKLSAAQIEGEWKKYDTDPSRNHWVQPKLVYISQPTELGTLYSKQELRDIYAVCRTYNLYLFIDGARMGYGLASPANDLTLPDITANCDMFLIGGTKVGALFGEALVISNEEIKADFFSIMKQGGAVLAKGRLLGIQFKTLFEKGLYFEISSHAVTLAMKIKTALKEAGIPLLIDSPTNQQFPIFTKEQWEVLSKQFVLALWEYLEDGRIAARICTSWATREDKTDELIAAIRNLAQKI